MDDMLQQIMMLSLDDDVGKVKIYSEIFCLDEMKIVNRIYIELRLWEFEARIENDLRHFLHRLLGCDV